MSFNADHRNHSPKEASRRKPRVKQKQKWQICNAYMHKESLTHFSTYLTAPLEPQKIDEQWECWTLRAIKNVGTYRGGGGTTPVTTACPEDRWGENLLRVELKSKSDDKQEKEKRSPVLETVTLTPSNFSPKREEYGSTRYVYARYSYLLRMLSLLLPFYY